MSRGAWTVTRFISQRHRRADGTESARLMLAYKWRSPMDAKPLLYRVALGIDDTRANRRLWEPRRRQLEAEIVSGIFDPAKWFGTRAAGISDAPRTLGEFVTQHLEQLKGGDHTERTREQYGQIFGKHFFGSPLEHIPLAELHDGHLIAWRARMIESGLAASTINKIFQRVRTAVNSAFQRGLIPRPQSPAALVGNLREDDKDVDPFSLDEFVRICGAGLDEQRRALYLVAGCTGMRPAELLALPWSNVSFVTGVIAVRQQLVESEVTTRLKTRRSRRDVEMLPIVREALNEQRARTGLRSMFVFANAAGKPLNERTEGDDPWRRAIARAQVPYRPLYNLRHTYTSLMLSAGKPLQWVAAQLGHVSVRKIDEVYGRWTRTPASERLDLDELCTRLSRENKTPFAAKSGRI